ncbi:hypothetical protein [Caenimonas soli]|uniref:hypothetical protein n=1 Tax=Caenimonas soli TaxID=2735555 RepID=UPI001556F8C8|nr:hypothetical protein [Caenimonas soli]NPC54803.1 hypothetical protein [Caenimonas soli]
MRFAKQLAATATLMAVSAHSLAHDGHGLTGSHWHATDAAGLALVAVLAGLAIWLSRDK